MTLNCYINRTQKTQQELGQGIATSTEHKKHNKNYDRELLHQQNTKNTIRTMTVNCYINRTQITQQELGQGIATSTEHKKHNKNYDRELLHQQNTNNTIRT